jgi:hypothetical protein
MSMFATLRVISDADGAFLLADPSSLSAFLEGKTVSSQNPSQKVPFLQRLLQKAPPPAPSFNPADKAVHLDLDTSWHGIHFLITGDSLTPDEGELKPLGFLMYYGTPIDEEDFVYRFLSSEQVASIASALQPLTREGLEKRYTVADLVAADIYPFAEADEMDGDETDDDLLDLFHDVLEDFEKLKSFVLTAKQDGRALLVSLS